MSSNDLFIEYTHDQNPIKEWDNPEHLLLSFPSLFPYGIGGFFEERKKN